MRPPPFLAIIILLVSRSAVHALFMDMYDKVFQSELLDDCTVYVYDRVVDLQGPKEWCLRKKSNIVSGFGWPSNEYAVIYAFYVDDENIVNMLDIGYDKHPGHVSLISQYYFEANEGNYQDVINITNVNHTNTLVGSYRINGFIKNNWYNISYIACTNGVYLRKTVSYNVSANTADVYHLNVFCDPYYYQNVIKDIPTEVRIDPDHPDERQCKVGNVTFILHPIKQSIKTTVYGYDMFKNLSESFPSLAVNIHPLTTSFSGVIIRNGTLISPEGNPLNLPPMEKQYTEVPFFFVNNERSSYSPFFLYYKYIGQLRDFTVRFIYNDEVFEIFNPVKFTDKCGFEDDNVTVAAAPRVLKHDETSISLEVYFFLNNADFNYCIFEITYEYSSKRYLIELKNTAITNAYVHVETRSKTAVNCNYGSRTVHWLLAYTEGKEAELVSLDNDVSSPIFPCPLCGPSTMMYCDVNPESAKKYYSSVYVITGKEVRFVGVTRNGYMLRMDYYNITMSNEQYFAQPMSLILSLDDIHQKLQSATDESPIEVDPVAGSNDAGGLRYLWMISLPFVILTFLMELN